MTAKERIRMRWTQPILFVTGSVDPSDFSKCVPGQIMVMAEQPQISWERHRPRRNWNRDARVAHGVG